MSTSITPNAIPSTTRKTGRFIPHLTSPSNCAPLAEATAWLEGYRACTKPELVKRWLLGPPGWTMPICEIDLKVGGKYRYVWRHERDGKEMGMGGVYREIVAPERARDVVLKSPMEQGVAASYDRLAELLASRRGRGNS